MLQDEVGCTQIGRLHSAGGRWKMRVFTFFRRNGMMREQLDGPIR